MNTTQTPFEEATEILVASGHYPRRQAMSTVNDWIGDRNPDLCAAAAREVVYKTVLLANPHRADRFMYASKIACRAVPFPELVG